ncbi:hypothetical protein [Salmonella enterica]|uniref:hypothetical protein n=1 Tax=Salmonella enterica TaxID=28901 RepID=UPI0039BF3DD1
MGWRKKHWLWGKKCPVALRLPGLQYVHSRRPDAALRGKVGGTARIIAVLEPRSNTMKMGLCKDDLAPSLGRADEVFLLQPAHWSGDVDTLADMVVKTAQPGDHILVMSNGGFGGIHQKLLDGLAKKALVVG